MRSRSSARHAGRADVLVDYAILVFLAAVAIALMSAPEAASGDAAGVVFVD